MPSNIKIILFSGLSNIPLQSLEHWCTQLPQAERERAAGMKSEKRWRQFVAGRALLQQSLLDFFDLPLQLTLTQSGKPELQGASMSLSHSGDRVAVALSNTDVGSLGIDVETYSDRRYMRLARHYFAEQEVMALDALEGKAQQHCFFKFWVLKESLAKFTGEGLSGALLRSAFTLNTSAVVQAPSSYYARGESYALALTAAEAAKLECFEAVLTKGYTEGNTSGNLMGFEWRRQTRQFECWSPPVALFATNQ